jgi:isochorismate synthase
VAVDGNDITCHPLAGTIATDGVEDTSAYSTWLLGSTKNRVEHRYVIDDIVERLGEVGKNVVADVEPSLVPLRSVTHLGSHIHAERKQGISSLDALSSLHPTPAVGGLPRESAISLIEKLEAQPRGAYAGAVGWCAANGDGSWWVAIRGITFRKREFTLWAGAGIVADSDPIAEREETRNKLDSVMRAIGVGTLN